MFRFLAQHLVGNILEIKIEDTSMENLKIIFLWFYFFL